MSDSIGASTPNIFHVPAPVLPIYTPPDSYDSFRGTQVPLIIDNGASALRFGFSTSSSKAAFVPHSVPNVIAKFKERKYNQPLLLFGDGVDAESGAKGQAKTPWEGDVLLNFDALVCYFSSFRPYRVATSLRKRINTHLSCRNMHSTVRLFNWESTHRVSNTQY